LLVEKLLERDAFVALLAFIGSSFDLSSCVLNDDVDKTTMLGVGYCYCLGDHRTRIPVQPCLGNEHYKQTIIG
jgi:hypothetical protein